MQIHQWICFSPTKGRDGELSKKQNQNSQVLWKLRQVHPLPTNNVNDLSLTCPAILCLIQFSSRARFRLAPRVLPMLCVLSAQTATQKFWFYWRNLHLDESLSILDIQGVHTVPIKIFRLTGKFPFSGICLVGRWELGFHGWNQGK